MNKAMSIIMLAMLFWALFVVIGRIDNVQSSLERQIINSGFGVVLEDMQ